MKYLVDIVNFNADASCLSSEKWLSFLDGGDKSTVYKLFETYISQNKKVCLGITGATISDLISFNPEVITLINNHPNIFEIIARPYSHDIGLLRTSELFKKNVGLGLEIIQDTFKSFTPYFLPPEFMLTNHQVLLLAEKNIEGTFINPSRFNKEIQMRLPQEPYELQGVLDSTLKTIPIQGELTRKYLKALQLYDDKIWNHTLLNQPQKCVFTWRDGESPLLIPDSFDREAFWLKTESSSIQRMFLKEALNQVTFTSNKALNQEYLLHHYPIHSFIAWVKEFRQYGYLKCIDKIEEQLSTLSLDQTIMVLQLINSDILSAVEKKSPVVKLRESPNSSIINDFTLWRSERGFEGQEYLALFSSHKNDFDAISSPQAHMNKLKRRMEYLKSFATKPCCHTLPKTGIVYT